MLDNVEQLVTATPLVTDLLSRCPSVKVLSASRTASTSTASGSTLSYR